MPTEVAAHEWGGERTVLRHDHLLVPPPPRKNIICFLISKIIEKQLTFHLLTSFLPFLAMPVPGLMVLSRFKARVILEGAKNQSVADAGEIIRRVAHQFFCYFVSEKR